jgi:hypothetical protein
MTALITRSARRSTRHVVNGADHLRNLKIAARRSARREEAVLTRLVADGRVDADLADFTPSHNVDGRDVS